MPQARGCPACQSPISPSVRGGGGGCTGAAGASGPAGPAGADRQVLKPWDPPDACARRGECLLPPVGGTTAVGFAGARTADQCTVSHIPFSGGAVIRTAALRTEGPLEGGRFGGGGGSRGSLTHSGLRTARPHAIAPPGAFPAVAPACEPLTLGSFGAFGGRGFAPGAGVETSSVSGIRTRDYGRRGRVPNSGSA